MLVILQNEIKDSKHNGRQERPQILRKKQSEFKTRPETAELIAWILPHHQRHEASRMQIQNTFVLCTMKEKKSELSLLDPVKDN